ncbi:pentapeptide repeat-containing protein [Nostoc linckia FACHB-391]|uniref:Pentapeptide repeat-containing protein n=2 Tax=Nostoc TaxID=1177 RepID=A0ABR8II14_9NOSO|nr:pentapeptide repeat-containing protein [Nostoc linckia FACHB-391]MBD2650539.1 pentapeptide repeat-containing protein [Nostoc foliaceum FACHB-393]
MRANLKEASFDYANLEKANLTEAFLEDSFLVKAKLNKAILRGANLETSDLNKAVLKEANLEGANLKRADLEGANLEGANLKGANLEGANLEGANLEGANLEGTIFYKNFKINVEQIKKAKNWQFAHYDTNVNKQLGLSSNKPDIVSNNNKNTINDGCYKVDSKQRWQSFPLKGVKEISSIEGKWSVDDKKYNRVGTEGHSGNDALALEPYNSAKFKKEYPFGALLVYIPGKGITRVLMPNKISEENLTYIRMRINDNWLEDNGGELKICFK